MNIFIIVELSVAGEGPTVEWSYLPRKIVREKRLSFRGHGDCLIVLKLVVCLVDLMQVGVGEIRFHHHV